MQLRLHQDPPCLLVALVVTPWIHTKAGFKGASVRSSLNAVPRPPFRVQRWIFELQKIFYVTTSSKKNIRPARVFHLGHHVQLDQARV